MEVWILKVLLGGLLFVGGYFTKDCPEINVQVDAEILKKHGLKSCKQENSVEECNALITPPRWVISHEDMIFDSALMEARTKTLRRCLDAIEEIQ